MTPTPPRPPGPPPSHAPTPPASGTSPPRPPGGPPTIPPPKGGRWRRQRLIIVILAVALIGVGGIAVVLATGGDEAEAAEFEREPVETAGDNPFMPNVGTDQGDVAPPPDTGETFEGNTPGLYGGTMNQAQCDAEQLITFLEQNTAKAAAWAQVLGIKAADIRDYVSGLTPVVLRSDTYVTNHGFEGGRATSFPAVLQAGTAVLVDDKGAPVVKCYCGNPLTPPPATGGAKYSGPKWPEFKPTNITVIQTTTVVIETFTLVDPTTGDAFGRPVGTAGSEDGPAPEPPDDDGPEETTTTTSRIPTNATYNITLAGGEACGGLNTTSTTATLMNGQLAIQTPDDVPLTGTVNPDGTFIIDISEAEGTLHIDGRLDEQTITATATALFLGESCTFTLDGTRSG